MIELTRSGRAVTPTAMVVPPEEVTTFNFVRQLASMGIWGWLDVAVALHGKALEGSLGGVPGSGADLQMALEVLPGEWVHLLIQAKRLYVTGRYEAWHLSQLADLRRWARSVGAVPAVLLYNTEIGPFGALGTTVDLGGCCFSTVTRYGRRMPPTRAPNGYSPTALTLVVLPTSAALPAALNTDSPRASDVNPYAAPLECLACPSFAADGSTAAHPTTVAAGESCILPRSNTAPAWAGAVSRIHANKELGLAPSEGDLELLGAFLDLAPDSDPALPNQSQEDDVASSRERLTYFVVAAQPTTEISASNHGSDD